MEKLKEILTIKDLTVTFGSEHSEVRAVNNIHFSLRKGETLGIVGESGSGKSVSALSILGLIKNQQENNGGVIIFSEGVESTNLIDYPKNKNHKWRGKKIAMIFQEPMSSLNPVFTCGQQIVEALCKHWNIKKIEAEKRTVELLKKVRLPDPERIYTAYPHQLSGGQKQRVMIAMALSCEPAILIADEPTTALDVTVQKAILNLLNELKQELGLSIIFISHDLGVVAEVADRVLVMHQGNIVERGEVTTIFKNPQHDYTRQLLASRPPLSGKLKRLPIGQNVVQNQFLTQEEIDQRNADLRRQSPILEVKNLTTKFIRNRTFFGQAKSYLTAVDDVNFEVFPGETLGLVGESGCGKTTLGRTILRLVEATTGQVIFQGKDLLPLPEKEMRSIRKDIQIIFQDPYASLNPRLTVGAAIQEPMEFYQLYSSKAERKEKVIELLKTVQLPPEHYHRFPHEFSGGQRQRICIARALAVNPKFLICDECVSALDVSVQAQILNLLLDLREKKNLTYLFISHDLSVVRFISDRIAVMNQGKIEEIGTANAIYENPKTLYTRRLIESIPKGF